ncbi:hypothetical protein ACWGBN_00785, partial [Streptomyces anulatus]
MTAARASGKCVRQSARITGIPKSANGAKGDIRCRFTCGHGFPARDTELERMRPVQGENDGPLHASHGTILSEDGDHGMVRRASTFDPGRLERPGMSLGAG